MTDDERTERAKARLQASPGLRASIEAALAPNTLPPAVASALSAAEMESVRAGAGSLESALPSAALEAIVQRFGRPPLVVRNDTVDLEPLPEFPPGTDALIKGVEPSVRSVGRVEFVNGRMPWGGTGWIIDAKGKERTIATNRHVAKIVAKRVADGRGVFLRSPLSGTLAGGKIDFREEVDSPPDGAFEVRVTAIPYLADDTAADVALLTIARTDGEDLPAPLPLAKAEAKAEDLVALIGYPAFDDRNDVADQARYFRDLFEVKRFAPGRILQAQTGGVLLTHDCTSLGGNSGSPLIGLKDGAVVGLHFAGVYGVENSAVGVRTLESLLKGDRPVSVAVLRTLTESKNDGSHKATDLADRDGYDPEFLDTAAAPWPGLPPEILADLANPSDATAERPNEIRYTHFGVLFSTSRRQPVMTAVNIDGAHGVRIKRKDDRWFADLRIPANIQLNQDDYNDPAIDRGHMVRREDPNWDTDAQPGADDPSPLAKRANDDTFHYTNAAVQHATLNQGKQLWLGLESYILDNARSKGFKACVFTGPVLGNEDIEVKPGVIAPIEFWKLVAMVDVETSKLHATAYVLSQGDLIRRLVEERSKTEAVEGFVLGEYRTFQIAIRDLAAATGYDLSTYETADPLAKTKEGAEAIQGDQPLFIPLDELADVVM